MAATFFGLENLYKQNQETKAKQIEEHYGGLSRKLDVWDAGDKDHAGQGITEHLKGLGVIPDDAKWSHEPDKDSERMKLIKAQVKLFDKGKISAQEFYEGLGRAANYDPTAGESKSKTAALTEYHPKLGQYQQKGLESAQGGSMDKLTAQYIAALSSPTDTMEGANTRLAATGQVDPNDPDWQRNQAEMIPLIQQNQPGLLSNEFLSRELSQMNPAAAAKIIPSMSRLEASGSGSTKITTIPVGGKTHKVLINNSGEVVKDLGEDSEAGYKTQEPKHRGKESGQPYVWNPNAKNDQTGGLGAYIRLNDGKPLTQTGESLIPLELKLAPTPIMKEANFTKSAIQRLQNMAKYYKPEYVGIIQGRIANPERKLKELPPEQVKFYREFKQFNDDIVRAKEGAVIPDAMMKRLEQFLNDIKQPHGNFEAQFDSIVDYTRDQGKNLDESIEGQYVSPFRKHHRNFFTDRASLLGGKKPKSASGSKFKIVSVGD